jgi:hypothetical protein
MIKQETMKPGEKVLIMALWLLNPSLYFSGFHGFLLTLFFRNPIFAAKGY